MLDWIKGLLRKPAEKHECLCYDKQSVGRTDLAIVKMRCVKCGKEYAFCFSFLYCMPWDDKIHLAMQEDFAKLKQEEQQRKRTERRKRRREIAGKHGRII